VIELALVALTQALLGNRLAHRMGCRTGILYAFGF
jgi:hypothetical protein